jgi:hypothetical protein
MHITSKRGHQQSRDVALRGADLEARSAERQQGPVVERRNDAPVARLVPLDDRTRGLGGIRRLDLDEHRPLRKLLEHLIESRDGDAAAGIRPRPAAIGGEARARVETLQVGE